MCQLKKKKKSRSEPVSVLLAPVIFKIKLLDVWQNVGEKMKNAKLVGCGRNVIQTLQSCDVVFVVCAYSIILTSLSVRSILISPFTIVQDHAMLNLCNSWNVVSWPLHSEQLTLGSTLRSNWLLNSFSNTLSFLLSASSSRPVTWEVEIDAYWLSPIFQ